VSAAGVSSSPGPRNRPVYIHDAGKWGLKTQCFPGERPWISPLYRGQAGPSDKRTDPDLAMSAVLTRPTARRPRLAGDAFAKPPTNVGGMRRSKDLECVGNRRVQKSSTDSMRRGIDGRRGILTAAEGHRQTGGALRASRRVASAHTGE
jgi:hypothetical protein